MLLFYLPTVTAERTSVIKRAGDEVMMSCSKLIDGQQNCRATTWTFTGLKSRTTEALFTLGQINSSKPKRLNLTSNCSLVIKKVREEDAGRYDCQQWKPENTQTPFHQSDIDLSVVNLTEQKENHRVTLNCSVVTSDPCRYKVQWFDQDVNIKESPSESGCSATVTSSSGFKFPQCKVTQTGTNEEFTFSLQPSGGKVKSTIKPASGTTTRPKTDNVSKTSEVKTDGNSGPTMKPGNRNSLSVTTVMNVSPSDTVKTEGNSGQTTKPENRNSLSVTTEMNVSPSDKSGDFLS
ncbi:uncharacterized protein LOC107837694 [Poecilia formosa]|uniref:uncharacterized protein LOC107837694 n=1 Tax=Poecilia formosa TaxID=48698 RepID=UPI0007BA5D56|nr:PREDICTED: uncharacterized protein LOC107837694 [Poecilia formosa]